MPTPSEKLQKLEERQRRIQTQIERVKAAKAAQERKRDARRKIVVDAMVLGLVERGEWPRERLLERLDAYLKRDHDRALFDLPPREDETRPVRKSDPSPATAESRV